MSKMNKEKMVWIDLETTGLDPESCLILEVACIVTDNDLMPLGGISTVIQRSAKELDVNSMGEWCFTQHSKSGLLVGCLKSQRLLVDVEEDFVEFLEEHEAVNAPLCGSSVHFDRGFIQRWMPKLFEKLHYRNFDTSTVKQMWERWLPDVKLDLPGKRELHRGLDDLEDSLVLTRVYRDALVRMQTAAGWD